MFSIKQIPDSLRGACDAFVSHILDGAAPPCAESLKGIQDWWVSAGRYTLFDCPPRGWAVKWKSVIDACTAQAGPAQHPMQHDLGPTVAQIGIAPQADALRQAIERVVADECDDYLVRPAALPIFDSRGRTAFLCCYLEGTVDAGCRPRWVGGVRAAEVFVDLVRRSGGVFASELDQLTDEQILGQFGRARAAEGSPRTLSGRACPTP